MPGKTTTVRFLTASALSLLATRLRESRSPSSCSPPPATRSQRVRSPIICAVPQVLAGVLGGAVLDRLNRRNVSIFSDIVSALCVAALPIGRYGRWA